MAPGRGVSDDRRSGGGGRRAEAPVKGAKDVGQARTTDKTGMRRQAKGLAARLAQLPFP